MKYSKPGSSWMSMFCDHGCNYGWNYSDSSVWRNKKRYKFLKAQDLHLWLQLWMPVFTGKESHETPGIVIFYFKRKLWKRLLHVCYFDRQNDQDYGQSQTWTSQAPNALETIDDEAFQLILYCF